MTEHLPFTTALHAAVTRDRTRSCSGYPATGTSVTRRSTLSR
jgi:hypothetical protein